MGVIPFRYRAATRVIATISPTRDAILTSDATVPSIETVQQLYPKQFADGLDHSRLAGREHCRYTASRNGKRRLQRYAQERLRAAARRFSDRRDRCLVSRISIALRRHGRASNGGAVRETPAESVFGGGWRTLRDHAADERRVRRPGAFCQLSFAPVSNSPARQRHAFERIHDRRVSSWRAAPAHSPRSRPPLRRARRWTQLAGLRRQRVHSADRRRSRDGPDGNLAGYAYVAGRGGTDSRNRDDGSISARRLHFDGLPHTAYGIAKSKHACAADHLHGLHTHLVLR